MIFSVCYWTKIRILGAMIWEVAIALSWLRETNILGQGSRISSVSQNQTCSLTFACSVNPKDRLHSQTAALPIAWLSTVRRSICFRMLQQQFHGTDDLPPDDHMHDQWQTKSATEQFTLRWEVVRIASLSSCSTIRQCIRKRLSRTLAW